MTADLIAKKSSEERLKELALRHRSVDVPSFGAEIARFTPSAILSLIEDNERLRAERDEARELHERFVAMEAETNNKLVNAEARASQAEKERDEALSLYRERGEALNRAIDIMCAASDRLSRLGQDEAVRALNEEIEIARAALSQPPGVAVPTSEAKTEGGA